MATNDWIPFPKQEQALSQTAFEILFGGSRGPGKTDAGMAFPLYHINNPLFRALVIRRNADDLSDWVDRAERMYARCGAVKKGLPAEFHFPSGAVVRTGHLKDQNAYTKYQGHEYQCMIIEELTQIAKEENYVKLIASCRSTIPGIPAQVFSTANPGEIGHEWVKERFRCGDPDQWYKPFIDPATNRSRVFIHATVDDNPKLIEVDPDYVRWLDGLPEDLRQQWRYGSWDDYDVSGGIFTTHITNAQKSGRITSVPHNGMLTVETWWDLGWNDTNSIWFTQRVGKEIRVIDFYQDNFKSLFEYIQILHEWSTTKGYKYQCHHFPHDFRVTEYSDGKSREEKFKEHMYSTFNQQMRLGIDYNVVPRMKSHMDGIDAARELLPYCWFDAERCREGLHALKKYRFDFDEKKNRFRDKPLHDDSSHAASAFIQCALGMKEQLPTMKKKGPPVRAWNPLTGEYI